MVVSYAYKCMGMPCTAVILALALSDLFSGEEVYRWQLVYGWWQLGAGEVTTDEEVVASGA